MVLKFPQAKRSSNPEPGRRMLSAFSVNSVREYAFDVPSSEAPINRDFRKLQRAVNMVFDLLI